MKTESLTLLAASVATTAHAESLAGGWLSGGLFSRFLDEGKASSAAAVAEHEPRFLQSREDCGDVQCYIWGTCVELDNGESECQCLISEGVRVNPDLPGTMGDHPGVFGCLDIDECTNEVGSENVCALGAGGFCVDWDPPVKYQCGCLPGYRDRRFDSQFGAVQCSDINECRDGVDGSSGIFPCSANAACSNFDGGFTCTCNDGFVGDGIDCFETDTPSPAPTEACTSDESCINGGFGEGSFCEFDTGKCLCDGGYFSINPGFTACVFRNICTTSKNPCDGPRATCTPNKNADDFADCKCIPGFEATPGSEEGESCISSNSCAVPPQCTTVADCPSNCSCTNGQCTCNPGFECINVHVTAGSDGISQILAPEGTELITGIPGYEAGDLFICTDDVASICGAGVDTPDFIDCPGPTPAPTVAPADLGSIAGNVSEDIDNDNLGERPLMGVTIRLFLNGGFIASTVTNAAGNYLFTGLAFSDFYTVTQTNLPGYSDVSDIDPANGPNTIAVEIGGADPNDSTGNDFVDELTGPITPTPAPTSAAPARRILFDLEEVESLAALATESSDCACVECKSDVACGGLWKGDAIGGDSLSFNAIHVIVSHCKHSLDWLENYVAGYPVKSITVVSKCNQPVEGAPANAEIIRLSNVGRNDHTFANWMASADYDTLSADTAVVFLKDDIEHMHQSGTRRSFGDMLRITSQNKFACGVQPGSTDNVASLSVYHESSTIQQFDLDEYSIGNYELGDSTKFNSPYSNLGEWATTVGIKIPELILPVCYGGVFATTGSQITAKDQAVWSKLRRSLERGENIEEGHFAERVWASLLSNNMSQSEITSIVQYSDGIVEDGFGYTGTLAHSGTASE